MKNIKALTVLAFALIATGCSSTPDRARSNIRCTGHTTYSDGKVVRDFEDCYWGGTPEQGQSRAQVQPQSPPPVYQTGYTVPSAPAPVYVPQVVVMQPQVIYYSQPNIQPSAVFYRPPTAYQVNINFSRGRH